MVTDDCVLAIDLGTGGPKVAIVRVDGSVLAWSHRSVSTRFVGDGGAEQDPHEMWASVVAATRDVLGRAGADGAPARFAAVAVTSQYMSIIPVAANGMPTGPCVLWMDVRGADHNRTLLNDTTIALCIERHGLIPLPSGSDNIAHIHVLRRHHPDAYAAADAFVEPMDYINARLCGRVVATQSTMFGQLVCDNRTWGTVEYDPALVAATRLDPGKLPELHAMNGFIGEVGASVASELGLAAGIPVAVGTIDSITSAVGSGAIDSSAASVVIGTTSVMVSHIDRHRSNLVAGILAVPSPLTGQYFVMAENGVGGRALEWASRLFGYGDVVNTAIDDAGAVAPGADGVGFLPWLLGSIAPNPNDDVRAAFVGMSLQHGRDHAIRAVLEGVALNLAWLLPAVEQFMATTVPFVRFGGGGAQSGLWAQILADALNRPVHQLAEPRTTNARGAAFLAFADLGRISIADVPGLLRVAAVHEPRAAHRAAMDAGLARLIALHAALGAS